MFRKYLLCQLLLLFEHLLSCFNFTVSAVNIGVQIDVIVSAKTFVAVVIIVVDKFDKISVIDVAEGIFIGLNLASTNIVLSRTRLRSFNIGFTIIVS